ncbi:MAG: O-antigen ligase family protein, partial [Candidatus Krumholzibacteria bacterium]|nr:O-antigen ligase family protein [Candidatus Krumholzibacteria bacterium]
VALVIASLFALDPSGSWPNVKKALPFAVVPVAAYHARDERVARAAIATLFVSAAVATLYALVRFAHDGGVFPARVRGLVGHPLTYGGQAMLLLSLCAGVALAAREWAWRGGAVVLAFLVTPALLGSFTRSAWIGTFVSFTVILARTRARWLPLLGAVLAVAVFLLPAGYRVRALSAFDTRSIWNVERLLLWESGVRIARDHPVTGAGLQDLRPLIERHRKAGAHETHGHMHNVPLQVAATMGAIGLAALAFLGWGLWRTASFAPRPPPGFGAGLRHAALGALAGFMAAGLFEWNLGDEELVNFLCVIVGLAFAVRAWQGPAVAPASPATSPKGGS